MKCSNPPQTSNLLTLRITITPLKQDEIGLKTVFCTQFMCRFLQVKASLYDDCNILGGHFLAKMDQFQYE